MTVPIVENFAVNSSDSNPSLTLDAIAPSGIVAGELLLLILTSDFFVTTGDDFFDAISGWTKVNESLLGDRNGARIAVYWKEAAGGEGDQAFTFVLNSDVAAWFLRISGADTTSPIDAELFSGTLSDLSSHVIGEVTTTVADCLGIYGLAFDGGDGFPFSVSGTGWSESDEVQTGTSGTNLGACFGTKSITSAGLSVDATISCSATDGASYFQIAIAPAGGAPSVSIPVIMNHLRNQGIS